ncbi:MAG TPA: right-handed parallel beta-helix repeat-containing protein [Phycisphaerales bacterium]|nr:right-handed parallel beta-helix repeat-containing protein [Phycisphaerales bacterium]
MLANREKWRAVTLCTLAGACATAHAEVRFIRADLATGANTGTSWADAFRGPDALARAISASSAGDHLWVAGGATRYIPSITGDRAATFPLKAGVTLLGGFAGDESQADQRNPAANPTILSGDLSGNDGAWPTTTGRGENSHHVLSATGADMSGTIDGFTITGGYANVGGQGLDSDKGAGLIVLSGGAPSIINCRFVNNRTTFGGGAVYIRQSSPTLTDCVLSSNIGGTYGGACDMAGFCNPVWTRCRIENNTAGRAGGVEVFGNSQPVFSNCLFTGNTSTATATMAPKGGGGLYIQQSSVTVRNCTFAGNTSAVSGGGILAVNSAVRVANSILWNNRGPGNATTGEQLVGSAFTALYSIVQGGYAGGTAIQTADPLFVSAADYHLQAASPAIDAGNNAEAGAEAADLDRRSRKIDDPRRADTGAGGLPVVDIGCFERPYHCPADMGGAGGTPGADGQLDNNDFVVFIDRFFTSTPSADLGGTGGTPGADGRFDNNDFVVFIDAFFAACP